MLVQLVADCESIGVCAALDMSEALKLRKDLESRFKLTAKILDSAIDGYTLCIDKSLVNKDNFVSLSDFVNHNKLNLYMGSRYCIISTSNLAL